ncbi:MAG: Nif3-like dinuclear metal center hexameric protein [Ignavibacteria bacterium]|nr:Nif3-like dinuclear metal center hexameric protein [Ignavibacteria bacterium]
MTVADIEKFFDIWAPRWAASERDNVGLQVGHRLRSVKRILVALDVTAEVVSEAARKKVDLIVSHHPLLFRPPSSITSSDRVGRLVLTLAQKKIAVFSAHTNLDSARDGVSFSLARVLGLQRIRFLAPLKDTLVKLAVFVPEGHAEGVTSAMTTAGAGVIGNYTSCSFRLKGTGTFRGAQDSKPFVGRALQLESVDEVRLEMIVPRARLRDVIAAMKSAHPYEEVAYDVYPLQNEDPNFGMGAIGELPRPVTLKSLLNRTKRRLNAEALRYVGHLNRRVRRVAVCGGSGSELLNEAIAAGADVFLTADIRYHAFHEAQDRIALVDAGHWETEHPALAAIERRLREFINQKGDKTQVFLSKYSTNPTHSR